MSNADFIGTPDWEGSGERIQMHRMQTGVESARLQEKGLDQDIYQRIENDPSSVSVREFVDYSQAVGDITPGGLLNKAIGIGQSAPEARTTLAGRMAHGENPEAPVEGDANDTGSGSSS